MRLQRPHSASRRSGVTPPYDERRRAELRPAHPPCSPTARPSLFQSPRRRHFLLVSGLRSPGWRVNDWVIGKIIGRTCGAGAVSLGRLAMIASMEVGPERGSVTHWQRAISDHPKGDGLAGLSPVVR